MSYYKLPMDRKMQSITVPSTASLSLDELAEKGIKIERVKAGVTGKEKRDDKAPLYGATYQDNVLHEKQR